MRTLRDAYYKFRSIAVHTFMPMVNKQVHFGKGFKLTNSVINYRGGELSIGDGFFY